MHDHHAPLAVAHRIAGKTRGCVVERGPKDEDIAARNVGVVGKRQNVDPPRRRCHAGCIRLLRENWPEDDLCALVHRLDSHGLGLCGLTSGIVDAQVDLDSAKVGNRKPRRVLQRPGQQLVTGLPRSAGHQQGHGHRRRGVDRGAARRGATHRLTGGKGEGGKANNNTAQRLAGTAQNGQHVTSSSQRRGIRHQTIRKAGQSKLARHRFPMATAPDQPGPAGPSGTARKIPPGLHFIATPIGAARDITLRALDLLAGADVLAAEDTRSLRHLMEIHGLAVGGRPLVAYHEHNEASALPRLMRALVEGKSVVYASEAGTPLISDPGFGLARAAIAEGLPVLAAPGASAVLCALTVSGLPSDRFLFAGFVPSAKAARIRFLEGLSRVEATVIVYKSPKRVHETLCSLVQTFGEERKAAVCRELTKKFEDVTRGTLAELAMAFADRDVKGEIVLVLDRAVQVQASAETIEAALDKAMETMSVKDAAGAVAEAFGMARRDVYQLALTRGRA